MPTDRIVIINIQGFGTYDDAGVYHDGPDNLYRRWATLIDTSITSVIIPGGERAEVDAAYRVHYFKALANADVRITTLTDADGHFFDVQKIIEPTGRDGNTRRRWLEVECLRPDPNRARDIPSPDEIADQQDGVS